MIPLLLVRHGKTAWNLQKKLQGRRDIPLCPEGMQELSRRGLPAGFEAYNWVSSPLVRAQETAVLLGGRDIRVEPTLIEMDWGDWEGFTIPTLRERLGDAMEQNEARGLDMQPTGGESPRMVQERLRPWLAALDAPTVAVTHKGVIRAIKSLAYQWDMKDKFPLEFDWSAAHLFDIDGKGEVHPVRLNISLENT
ncbi:histidine phosphatase family protein [Sneathiella chinensis]|uniref:Phosphoglycerate mutase n=1 Tax=Sneathiella chinensis TaxID=349750 RepID=A0ABQ5U0G9_9PROT|nr:histidine phosphatase family protein [Sneathiella chinensis]GLQ05233.1 phosphoglycerate mutase [Sneathiella chinensis]